MGLVSRHVLEMLVDDAINAVDDEHVLLYRAPRNGDGKIEDES